MYSVTERSQVMELVQTLNDEQISYIFNIIQSMPRSDSPRKKCSLRGRFASYANPELRAKEKEAWALAAEEKEIIRRSIGKT
ncbi:MAG: hypothetical protein J6P28_07780 [Treponema sp.]|nr:hypothetical protein [Treponema sp.]